MSTPPASKTSPTVPHVPDLSRRCSAKSKRTGEPCGSWAMRGTTVCRMHGGAAAQVKRKRREVVEKARTEKRIEREVARLGGSIEIHPLDALIEQVAQAAHNVEVYRLAVAELGIHIGRDDNGRPGVASGEYFGERYHVDAMAHIFVEMYNGERDRLVKYAKLCLDAGIDERRVRMQEARGRELAEVVREAIDAMSPTPEQREAGYRAAAEAMRRRSVA